MSEEKWKDWLAQIENQPNFGEPADPFAGMTEKAREAVMSDIKKTMEPNAGLLGVWTNDIDTVIAYSAADAMDVLKEMSALNDDEDEALWERHPDDKPLTITDVDNNGTKETLTCAEWIEREGRGFLCSTEY